MKAFLAFFILACMPVFAQEKPDSPPPKEPSYFTPELSCREGFHKTAWFEPGYPYYIECEKNRREEPSYPLGQPAKNRNWFERRDKPFLLGSAAMSGSSIYMWRAAVDCRERHGPEGCLANYGALDAVAGINIGMSTIVWPAVFHSCRKEFNKSKWCWTIPAVDIAVNVGFGIRQQLTPTIPRERRD